MIFVKTNYKYFAIIKQKRISMLALTQEQLFDEIETLPIELKTKMIDKLLISISPIKQSIDDLWTEEVLKRKKQIDSGEVTLIDGEEVFRKIGLKFNA